MDEPFKECKDCLGRLSCKIRTGDIKPSNPYSCKPKIFLDRAINLANLPEAYKDANIYSFEDAIGNNITKKSIAEEVDDIFENVMKGRNICITGKSCGIGKTYLACVFVNHFIYKASQRLSPENAVATFVDYAYLMDRLRYSDDPAVDILFQQVQTVPLLLLDDIGAGTMTDYSREQTFIIANSRAQNKLATIITSNLTVAELKSENVLGARISSRLMAGALFIQMTGKDRRIEGADLIV